MIKKLSLGRFFLIPIILSFVFWGLSLSVVYYFSDDIGAFVGKIWPWEWGKNIFLKSSTFLGGFSILLFCLILYKHVVMALSSPFMSPVSEKIELFYQKQTSNDLTIHKKTSFQQQLFRAIRISVRNLTKELLFTIPLLIISFIPIIGLIVTPLIFLIQAYYVGFSCMDYTLERHFNYKKSLNFVKNNRGIAIGNGIIFMLLLFIPIIGFIVVLPLSVTASSLKTIERIHQNKR